MTDIQLTPPAHAALEHHVRAERGEHSRFGPALSLVHLQVAEASEPWDADAPGPEQVSRQAGPDAILIWRRRTQDRDYELSAWHRGHKIAESTIGSTRAPHPLYGHRKAWYEPAPDAAERAERTVPTLARAAKIMLQARHDYRTQQHDGLLLASQELSWHVTEEENRLGVGITEDVHRQEFGAHTDPGTLAYRRLLAAQKRLDHVTKAAHQAWQARSREWKRRLAKAGAEIDDDFREWAQGYGWAQVAPAPAEAAPSVI